MTESTQAVPKKLPQPSPADIVTILPGVTLAVGAFLAAEGEFLARATTGAVWAAAMYCVLRAEHGVTTAFTAACVGDHASVHPIVSIAFAKWGAGIG